MAKINVFEGSRRIALLLGIIWVIAVIAVAYSTVPSVRLYFKSESAFAPFRQSKDDCRSGTDGIEFVDRDLEPGKSAWVQLCFKAQAFGPNQQELVPYKTDEKGMTWGNEPYSSDVSTYKKKRADGFELNDSQRQKGLKEWQAQRWANAKTALYFAVGGWIALSVSQFIIGWIVRGFAGIPWGHDRRPEGE